MSCGYYAADRDTSYLLAGFVPVPLCFTALLFFHVRKGGQPGVKRHYLI
jgi:hypothetical protein